MRGKTRTANLKAQVKGMDLPVRVVLERRFDCRYAISRRSVILRLPHYYGPEETLREMHAMLRWVEQMFDKDPRLMERFHVREYRSGDTLTVGERRYTLHIAEEDRQTHTGRLKGSTIVLRLRQGATPSERAKAIRTLLSRVVAGDFQREIEQRVLDINRRTVNRPIRGIYLKYTISNWGSCSSRGNINLSTRLLFAPREVQDYVILHELAHLVEPNHSDRFWAVVAQHMPDFERHEAWLRQHGPSCDF
ncbi:MAG: M48 family metallopeptidase [Saprospiraceae bacterium]|nr:M48 family metallopeptidase [Saprospiraceae bacterium]MDW8228258.1 M48 family metallopeptidase [Saprospiraceae bacterium]